MSPTEEAPDHTKDTAADLHAIASRWKGSCGNNGMGGSASVLLQLHASQQADDRQKRFDPSQHVSIDDVATDSQARLSMVQINLKRSKTNPFRQGVTIVVGATDNELCPSSPTSR